LCAGIATGLYSDISTLLITCLTSATALALACAAILTKKYTSAWYGILLFILVFLGGLLLYNTEINKVSRLEKKEYLLSGSLAAYPEEKAATILVILKLHQAKAQGGNAGKAGGSVMIYLKKDSDFSYMKPGDLLVIKCEPSPIENRGNPFEFNYKLYALTRGIRHFAFAGRGDILRYESPAKRGLKAKALITREKIIGMFSERGISGQNLATVAAITLGEKKLLEEEHKENFIKAGIMHIMAVSGLHAMILSLVIFKALFFVGGRFRFIRSLAAVVLLWVFAFITGLSPSVMRAVVMFTFLQSGTLLRRPVNSLNSVLASAFFLLLVKPSMLFGTGFLLSYSAVIFLVCFASDFISLIPGLKGLPGYIWKGSSVSLVAQAGTLPLTLLSFNRFPVLFIISNLVVIPVTTVILVAGLLVIISYPFGIISEFIAHLLDIIVSAINLFTSAIADIPFSTIENTGLMNFEAILLLAAVFAIFKFITNRKNLSPVLPLALVLVFFLGGSIKELVTANSSQLIVYNENNKPAAGLRKGRTLHFFSSDSLPGNAVMKHISVMNLRLEQHIIRDGNMVVTDEKKKILIAERADMNMLREAGPDIVIAGSFNPGNVSPASMLRLPCTMVLTGSNDRSGYYHSAAKKAGIDSVYFVKNEGAFRYRIK